jgi:nickel-dependent lactate racemase
MTTISLAYDSAELDIDLPDSVRPVKIMPRDMPALENPRDEFMRALQSPVAGPPLSELARDARGRVIILCSDGTRVCGKERSLIWLVDALNGHGIPDDRITVLVTLGTHKPPPDERLPDILGPVVDRVEIAHHDINGPMIDRGVTSRGTPVRVSSKIREAGLILPTFGVTHHYFAGYTGGRKLVAPGISAIETIRSNHSFTWKNPRVSSERHPLAASGVLTGNPVHEDMLECARLALGDTPAFAVATVLTPDKDFGFFASGELDAAHRAACAFADNKFMIDIDSRAELIFASAGGYPKDTDLIQSHKGMDNAVRGLKPGGTMVYAMGCRDGAGHPVVEELAPLGTDEIRDRLTRQYEIYGQTTHIMKLKARDYRVIAISQLDPKLLMKIGFIPASCVEEALEYVPHYLVSTKPIYYLPRADLTVLRPSSV